MKRRSTACRIVQAFILALLVMVLPVTVFAQETTLTTTVPSGHILHIEVTGDGTIIIDGVTYTQAADLQVQRHHRPEISIQPADGSKIKTVFWGSENVTANFPKGEWTAPEITEDMVLSVTFEKMSSTPQTGDTFPLNFWTSVLIISALGMVTCLLNLKKKVQ